MFILLVSLLSNNEWVIDLSSNLCKEDVNLLFMFLILDIPVFLMYVDRSRGLSIIVLGL